MPSTSAKRREAQLVLDEAEVVHWGWCPPCQGTTGDMRPARLLRLNTVGGD